MSVDRYLIITAEESDSTVGFYDSKDGTEVARVAVGTWPHEIDLSADRKLAFVTNFGVKDYDERIGEAGASISIIDIETKCEVDRLYTFRNEEEYWRFRGPHGIKLHPNGQSAFVNVETEDTLLVYDLTDGRSDHKGPQSFFSATNAFSAAAEFESLPDESLPLPAGTHYMLFSADGKSLWVVAGRGGVTEIDLASRQPIRGFRCRGAVRGLSYTIDQKYLIASASNEICLIDPATLRVEKRFADLGVRQFLYTQPTPDGKFLLAPAVWEGQLLKIEIETGQVQRMIIGSDPIHIMPGPDYPEQSRAYVTHGRSKYVSIIDWENFTEVGRIATKGGPNGIAWAPYSTRPTRTKLPVGACLPLSGQSIVEGQDLRLGYQYWGERVNASGGIQVGEQVYDVDLHFADSQSRTGNEPDEPQPWQAHWTEREPAEKNTIEKLTEALVNDHDVRFLFGGYPSPPNLHSGRIAESKKRPLITASGAAGTIYEQGFRHVFGAMTSAKGFLNETFRYFETTNDPPATVLFVSCKDPAARQDAETTAQYITDHLQANVVSTDTWPDRGANGVLLVDHGQTDFERLIEIAAEVRPDVIAYAGHLNESVALVEEARRQKFEPKAIVFSVGPAVPQFVDQLKDLSHYLIGTAMWSSVQKGFGHDRFIRPAFFHRDFFARFSRLPGYLAAGAMACGVALEEAIRQAGSVEADAVSAAMREIEFESFYPHIQFNDDGLNDTRPLLTIQLGVEDGQVHHVPLWPRTLAGSGSLTWPFPGWPEKIQPPAGHSH